MAIAWRMSSFQPAMPRHPRAKPRIGRDGQRRVEDQVAFCGSPSARSMTRWANRSTSAISPLSCLAIMRQKQRDRQRWVADCLQQLDEFIGESRCLLAVRFHVLPRHTARPCPIASDRRSPAAVHNSRSSSKPVSAPLPPVRNAFAHRSVRGAMRMVMRSGSSSGSRSATCRARRQLVLRRAHVAEGRTRYRRACASRRPHAGPPPPQGVRRSAPRSRPPNHAPSIATASRRCDCARTDLS